MAAPYQIAKRMIGTLYDRRIDTPPVLDPALYFPAAGQFAVHWRTLRDEALHVAEHIQQVPRFHEVMTQQRALSANDERDWRIFILKAYGVETPARMAQCPTLASLVRSTPGVCSAALSFMAPGKHIPPHRGPFRGIVRFYMGLSVPTTEDGRPAVVLTVDDEEYRIGDGEYLLWDDTYLHEVRNPTDQLRIALLLDVRRRHMPMDMRLLSSAIIQATGLGVRLRDRI